MRAKFVWGRVRPIRALTSALLLLVGGWIASPSAAEVVDHGDQAREKVVRTVAGQQVAIDPTTGRLRQPTAAEEAALSAALQEMFAQPVEEMQVVQLPDGTLMVELGDHFHNVALARIDQDGNVVIGCLLDAQSAEAFLSESPRKLVPKTAPIVLEEK